MLPVTDYNFEQYFTIKYEYKLLDQHCLPLTEALTKKHRNLYRF